VKRRVIRVNNFKPNRLRQELNLEMYFPESNRTSFPRILHNQLGLTYEEDLSNSVGVVSEFAQNIFRDKELEMEIIARNFQKISPTFEAIFSRIDSIEFANKVTKKPNIIV